MNKGDIINFGCYDWRVLEVQNDKALLISDKIIERKAYHSEWGNITWAECALRSYLNDAFYNSFGDDKSRIAETRVTTGNNLWFGTRGGNAANDRIFLLSIEEAVKYFGDSGQLKNKNPNSEFNIDDQYNAARVARDKSGTAMWWWLRSPGCRKLSAAGVGFDGSVDVGGLSVGDSFGGVRPALWLNF